MVKVKVYIPGYYDFQGDDEEIPDDLESKDWPQFVEKVKDNYRPFFNRRFRERYKTDVKLDSNFGIISVRGRDGKVRTVDRGYGLRRGLGEQQWKIYEGDRDFDEGKHFRQKEAERLSKARELEEGLKRLSSMRRESLDTQSEARRVEARRTELLSRLSEAREERVQKWRSTWQQEAAKPVPSLAKQYPWLLDVRSPARISGYFFIDRSRASELLADLREYKAEQKARREAGL